MTGQPALLLDAVHPNPAQPRRDPALTPAFVNSIRDHGVIIPVILHKNGVGYVIDSGHRRIAGLRAIGCTHLEPHEYVLREGTDDTVVRIANAHRRDLNPLEWAALFAIDEHKGATHEEIADTYGVSRGKVGQYLKLNWALEPEAREAVLDGHLTFAHARELSRLSDPGEEERDRARRATQREFIGRMKEGEWKVSTRRLAAWVTDSMSPPESPLEAAVNHRATAAPCIIGAQPAPVCRRTIEAIVEEGDDPLVLRDARAVVEHLREARRLLDSVLSRDSFNDTLSREVAKILDETETAAKGILEVLK